MALFLLQMLVEEGEERLLGLLRIGSLETVAGALQGQQFRLDVAGLQAVDEPFGLFVGDVIVLGAMNAQGRRGVRA